MVLFANPVHGVIHPMGWARPAGNHDFQLTRPFGDMSFPALGPHNGDDFANGRTGDPVLAGAPGTIDYADTDPLSGGAKIVIVNHVTARSWYAHLGTIAVRLGLFTGQAVTTGQLLGTVDTTGWATGPHLHFQVQHKINGVWHDVDPWPLLAQNQPAPVYVVVAGAGVRVRKAPKVDPTNIYATSGTPTGYLIGLKMKLGAYVAGGVYRYGDNGTLSGSTWAKVWLNGGYKYVAKPFVRKV